MLKYKVDRASDLSKDEKITLVKHADIGDLLNVIRDFEESPNNYDADIIKAVSHACFKKGLMLM